MELNAVEGLGHRKIAARLGRPESTVRDWIRTFKTNIPAITEAFTARVHRATAEALGFWPAPAKTAIANALGMLMAHARVLSHLHSTARGVVVTLTWHSAALFAHGPWFFSEVGWPERCNTSPPCR
ncbi:helix-turn-helix domain-containing protein [Arthrobacter sp. AQ5-05]|uniref:helix-turn-helix domain-containing protein n=1 Tax=Arthrobacter sp. AQ5-05 TaxID=2184581 RepID=UPI001C6550A8|nr:helix-turn-helix domain-containing protein [Arthrobacter sp. AQ5-05]